MKKSAVTLYLFLMGVVLVLGQQEKTALVFNVGLVSGQAGHRPHPPSKLLLGAELLVDVNYKLFHGDEVIRAGMLRSGFNVINIETRHWFERSSEHTFVLEVKSGEQLEQIPFLLLIELDSGGTPPAAEAGEAVVQPKEYSLALYLDEKRLATRAKAVSFQMPTDFDIPIMPRNYDPNRPDSHRDPLANTFSILDAVGLAYYLAREAFARDEDKKTSLNLRLQRQMTISYMRSAVSGGEKKVSATLTFKTVDDRDAIP
jgi:hypothetical protein